MPRRPTFPRRPDLIRAVRAARDAGIPNPCVVIDPINRTLTVKAGDDPPNVGGATANPWDEATNVAHQKRSA